MCVRSKRRGPNLCLGDVAGDGERCAPHVPPTIGCAEVQRVLHVARRVLGRHVERLEVVEVVFDFGAFEDLVAHAREDVLDLLTDAHQRMHVTERCESAGQRDVDGAGRRPRRLQRVPLLLDRVFDFGLERVDQTAEFAARLMRQRAERLHQAGNRSGLAAEKLVLKRLQRGDGLGRLEAGAEAVPEVVDS